jgi:hypothetical protein
MREIKFRAWDGKKFGYISIGYDRITWPSPDYLEQNFSGLREGSPEQVRFKDISAFQQYTGLTDKRRKEIYEGDIVECTYFSNVNPRDRNDNSYFDTRPRRGQIIWNTGTGSFEYKGESYYLLRNNHQMEVIGNIYENPELLR